jgi:U3 small nucleolar RNA-associated protein 20
MDIKTGQLDYTYPTLIPLLNSELFGEIQDEKEAEDKKKNFTEIKKNKAVETYSLLAQTMEFKNSFMPLIGYLQDQMQGDH